MWRINLPGMPLDLVSLPVRQSVVSLMAISIAGLGVRVYDEKHHVDTIKMMDSVSAMKVFQIGIILYKNLRPKNCIIQRKNNDRMNL